MRHYPSILLVFAVIGCGGGGSAAVAGPNPPSQPPANPPSGPSGTASIEMRSVGDGYGDFIHSFSPSSVTISRGGTVTWSNSTGQVHNVTFATATGAPASVPDHSSGANTRSFSTAGTFNFSCTNHPGMTGQVSVP